jgi:hypothetical protein
MPRTRGADRVLGADRGLVLELVSQLLEVLEQAGETLDAVRPPRLGVVSVKIRHGFTSFCEEGAPVEAPSRVYVLLSPGVRRPFAWRR